MQKKLIRGLCVLLCLVMVGVQVAFAYPNPVFGNSADLFDTHNNRGSYTYVDLGTVTQEFSSDEVIASVSILSRVITLGASIPAKTARWLADRLFKKITNYKENTLYYTSEVHTTQVFLDGQFVYYIIDTKVSIYSNSSRTNLIASQTHSGQSLSPASVPLEII